MVDGRDLQHLVDEQRYGELLQQVTLDDIARAWVRYQHREPQVDEPWENDPDWWAVELWMDSNTLGRDAWWNDEARVRDGILAIVAAADDDDAGIIGAAIMEVFIADDESRLAWVEEQAAGSDRFRRSLANVYIRDLGDAVMQRVGRAAGVTLPGAGYQPLGPDA